MTDSELKQWRKEVEFNLQFKPELMSSLAFQYSTRILHLLDLAEAAKEMASWYGDHQIKNGVGFTGCDEGKKARTFLDTYFGGKG